MNVCARTSARAAHLGDSVMRVNLSLFPDFLHVYLPRPPHPFAAGSRSVIVVAVAEYLPRARALPFKATV